MIRKFTLMLFVAIALATSANAQSLSGFLNKLSGSETETETETTTEESTSSSSSSAISNLTEGMATDGIKEALVNGVTSGVEQLSAKDGYYGNPLVQIAFPEEIQMVEKALRAAGLGSMADKGIELLNRAAEDAASEATDVFVSAITDMTVEDAVGIVAGDETAATDYLKDHTTDELSERFSPIIESSLGKVNAPTYWNKIMTKYNSLPLVKNQVEPDLTKYVTGKAIDGMFVKIAEEEALIREDPVARTSDLLDQVFGNE